MGKWWTVAKREFSYNIRRRAFIFASFVMPLLLALVLFIVFSLIASTFDAEVTDAIGYVDAAGVLTEAVEKPDNLTPYAANDEAQAALDAGTLRAYFVVPQDYLQRGEITLYRAGDLSPAAEDQIETYLRANLGARIGSEETARLAADPVELRVQILDSGRTIGTEGVIGLFLAPFLFLMLFLITVQSTAGYLMAGVVEEKSNRIMEVLVTSIPPFQLLAGKIVGLGALGLVQISVWLVLALGLSLFADRSSGVLAGISIPGDVVGLALLFFFLDYCLTATLMAGIGAVTATEQESRAVAGLFGILTGIPFFFIFTFFTNPNGPIPVFLTLFPFTAPIVIILRSAFTAIPPGEIIASFCILVLTTLAVMWASARIFRWSLLMYGKRPSLRGLLSALRGGTRMQTTATGEAT